MSEETRRFRGIWIPAEIWLSEDLSAQEKMILAEIDSLGDGDPKGCYCSNDHFCRFLGVKERQVQAIIKSLRDKGYVTMTITYRPGTKAVDKRYLKSNISMTITTPASAGQNSDTLCAENAESIHPEVVQETAGGGAENCGGVVQFSAGGGAENCALYNVEISNLDSSLPKEDYKSANAPPAPAPQPKKGKKKKSAPVDIHPDYSRTRFSPELMAAVDQWLQYKRERREGYKVTGLNALLTEIQNNTDRYGDRAVIDLITSCMANGYRGIIFERLRNYPEMGGPKAPWAPQTPAAGVETYNEFGALEQRVRKNGRLP